MNFNDRVVTQIPLSELWTDEGRLVGSRGESLDVEAVRALLRAGPVRFVIAHPGVPLRWIPLTDRFRFWKEDLIAHLAEGDRIYLDNFPDGYAYRVTRWLVPASDVAVVLLEVEH